MNKFFKVLHRSKYSKARVGEIHTAHGVIKTPAFVPCATRGTLKAILPLLIEEIGTQVAFVNTYHLVSHPGADIIAKGGGIHKWSGLNIPLMSDSGGFQVFSLANEKTISNSQFSISKHSSTNKRKARIRGEGFSGKIATPMDEEQPLLIKLSDDGVIFRSTYDGKIIEFTPEKSMEYQMKIEADMMMAFDECTYYPASHKYAERAMERTHDWLIRCTKYMKAQRHVFYSSGRAHPTQGRIPHLPSRKKQTFSLSFSKQFLYGVIQGATFEDLRKKSAKFVMSQNTDGVAIGGVSVGEGKKLMRDQVKWVADYLPADRPVHLLGVGQFDDILDLVGYGIDSFDCVEPTRLARMGKLYQSQQILSRVSFFTRATCCDVEDFEIDIYKTKYKFDLSTIDEDCNCYICQNFTKSYLHHLFKQKEILGYNLATYHNLWVMERFFDRIREQICQE